MFGTLSPFYSEAYLKIGFAPATGMPVRRGGFSGAGPAPGLCPEGSAANKGRNYRKEGQNGKAECTGMAWLPGIYHTKSLQILTKRINKLKV